MWRSSTSSSTSTRCGGAPPRRSSCTGRAASCRPTPRSRAISAGGRGIRWAVLDTGVRSDHPHFVIDAKTGSSRIAEIWDCTKRGDPVRLASDNDADGHGSHVAGIIAGRGTADDKEYLGLAPEARAGRLQGAGRPRRRRRRLDHQGARPHRRAEREQRAARGPRAEPESRRSLRLHGVWLRVHAHLPGAAASLALGDGRRGGLRQRGTDRRPDPRRRSRAELADVDRRPRQPRGLHRRRLGQRRQARTSTACPRSRRAGPRRTGAASPMSSRQANASPRSTRGSRASRGSIASRAAPAWRRRTSPA